MTTGRALRRSRRHIGGALQAAAPNQSDNNGPTNGTVRANKAIGGLNVDAVHVVLVSSVGCFN